MKIVRVQDSKDIYYGIQEGEIVKELAISPYSEQFDKNNPSFTGKQAKLSDVKLLVPCEPMKYIIIGANYSDLIAMSGHGGPDHMVTGLKPIDSVVPTKTPIIFPKVAAEIPNDAPKGMILEAEIAVIIGKKCKHVKKENYKDVVLGYSITNDVTFQKAFHDGDSLLVKGADTFGPVGPCVETDFDPFHANIKTWVSGELRQDGTSENMIIKVDELIEQITAYTTLYPGDIIATGTCAGDRRIRLNDTIKIEIPGIGVLENNCIADQE